MRHSMIVGSILALALAACGSGGGDSTDQAPATDQPATASAEQADPCSLVTAEEVGTIIGAAIVATKPGEGSCLYETDDAQASTVTIELDQADAAGAMDVARKAAGVLKDMGAAAAGEGGAGADVNSMLSDSGDAPKVGDEAFFGPNSQLSVRKGGSYIAVSPPMMRSRMAAGNPMLSAEDKQRMALEIARKAVDRLP